ARPSAPPRARRQITTPAVRRGARRRHRTGNAAGGRAGGVTGVRDVGIVVKRHGAPPRRSFLGLARSSVRLRILLVLLLVVLGAVLVKVGAIQSTGGAALRSAGSEQWSRTIPLIADRGSIFDRNGEELALSVPAYSISVNPKLVTDELGTAKLLQSFLGLDNGEVLALYEALMAKQRGFVYVRREVDLSVGRQIANLRLLGVNVDAEDRRVLPGGTVGLSVIGRTDIDGVGIAGLEKQYDELLTGIPGEATKEVAPRGRSIPGTERVTAVPVPGQDLVLTIDRSIQHASESLLEQRVGELGAKSGTIIVMDTKTGDVYAMASVLRNELGVVEVTSGNFAAVNAYEPGSVAKVITIASGLNQGAVTPESTFIVPWRRQYADDLLTDSHQHPDEEMTVERILIESSNIGTIDVQQSLDQNWDTARQVHWEYMRNFGLGDKTALDFPGESAGILKHWSDLWGSERVTVAYGQGLASTSIQLAAAVNTIANDGTYIAPRLVLGTVDAEGEFIPAADSPTREVLRSDVAERVQQMMRAVVCDPDGTGGRAQQGIESFSVAGKTGTGLKAQPNGTYLDASGRRVYYASFVGFFPAEDPQITVLVSIDEPPAGDINRFGGTAAAPVFAALAPTIVHERGIQPPSDSTACPVG
ncbi:MAG TPA: penicillin-binding protein 2, partial [Ilumatobacter sp.]